MERRSRAGLFLILLLIAGLAFILWPGRTAQSSKKSPAKNSPALAVPGPAAHTASFANSSPSTSAPATVIAAAAASKVNAGAAGAPLDNAPLSDSAREQIAALQKAKAARTSTERKMDSQLLHARKLDRGEPLSHGVRLQAPDLDRDERGRVLVDVTANVTDGLLRRIEASG